MNGKGILFFFLVAVPSFAASSRMELVQSVPLETTLAVPGVRQAQEVWLEMIRSAKSSLDLEQFYVSDQAGEALAPVLDAIHQASARGVQVRLLVDSKFFQTYPDSVTQIGKDPNSEARTIDFSKHGGVQHAKYFVVDGHNSFVGSQNFDWRALSHIHEIGVRVDDTEIAGGLEAIFAKDWEEGAPVSGTHRLASHHVITASRSGLPLEVVAAPADVNPPGIGYSLSAIEELIASAGSSVQVQVMEYSTKGAGDSTTWKDLDSALRAAAARGVQVQLMVDISDLAKARSALTSLSKLKHVSVKTVTIPPYTGGEIPYGRLIHSKYLIVDGTRGWVGSENWSEGYFTATRDVGLTTTDPDLVGKLGQVFSTVWQSAYASSL